jgi:hypothetical protein
MVRSSWAFVSLTACLTAASSANDAHAGSCPQAPICVATTPSSSDWALNGSITGAGTAVRGTSDTGFGVQGDALSGTTGTGVVGHGTGNGVAGYGTATNSIGVLGSSPTYIGVEGSSDSSNGVFAITGSTTAAAMSANSPSASGLAYWGTGGIEINGSFAAKAGGGSWSAYSDIRVKKDVQEFHLGLSELERVRPVKFKYNGLAGTTDDGAEFVGVIAQELEPIVPAMISPRPTKLHKEDDKDTDIKHVDPSEFTYLLINSVKELKAQNDALNDRVRLLEERHRPSVAGLGEGWIGFGLVAIAGAIVVSRRKRAEPYASAS